MYKLQPLFKQVQITPIPDCVYKMKKISDHFHTEPAIENQNSQSEDGELVELDKRWTEITSRLEKLQSDITTYKSTIKTDNSVSCAQTGQTATPPATIEMLTTQQNTLLSRISSLMSSLSDLKIRLALMDDPQNFSSTIQLQFQQNSLLERIKQLNDEIRAISSALSNNNNSNRNNNTCGNQKDCQSQSCAIQDIVGLNGAQETQDMVIRANPSRPPYSLPLIKEQMERLGIRVHATTHVHSTTALENSVTDKLKNFIRSDKRLERSKAQIILTLIWHKDCDVDPCLMISPSAQSAPIKGEANIVRYLVRRMPSLLDYERDFLRAACIDELLDMTDSSGPLRGNSSKREIQTALQSIEKVLAKSQALDGGNQLNAVDFVVYSAILNSRVDDKELGTETRSWMERCRGSQILTKTNHVPTLANSEMPTALTKRHLLEKYLTDHGIVFQTLEHPAVFTVAAMMEHVTVLPGLHAKNLFVKDKKSGRLYLVTARHDAPVQLNQLAKIIGAKELRFADAETLESTLGVQQGSVTPFALINDVQDHRVTLVLDSQLWDESSISVNFHPLTNEATTNITVTGFKTFRKATGHEPMVIKL